MPFKIDQANLEAFKTAEELYNAVVSATESYKTVTTGWLRNRNGGKHTQTLENLSKKLAEILDPKAGVIPVEKRSNGYATTYTDSTGTTVEIDERAVFSSEKIPYVFKTADAVYGPVSADEAVLKSLEKISENGKAWDYVKLYHAIHAFLEVYVSFFERHSQDAFPLLAQIRVRVEATMKAITLPATFSSLQDGQVLSQTLNEFKIDLNVFEKFVNQYLTKLKAPKDQEQVTNPFQENDEKLKSTMKSLRLNIEEPLNTVNVKGQGTESVLSMLRADGNPISNSTAHQSNEFDEMDGLVLITNDDAEKALRSSPKGWEQFDNTGSDSGEEFASIGDANPYDPDVNDEGLSKKQTTSRRL